MLSLLPDLLAVCLGYGGSLLPLYPLLPIPVLLETTLTCKELDLANAQRRQNRVLLHGQVKETLVTHGCRPFGWQDWI